MLIFVFLLLFEEASREFQKEKFRVDCETSSSVSLEPSAESIDCGGGSSIAQQFMFPFPVISSLPQMIHRENCAVETSKTFNQDS